MNERWKNILLYVIRAVELIITGMVGGTMASCV